MSIFRNMSFMAAILENRSHLAFFQMGPYLISLSMPKATFVQNLVLSLQSERYYD